VVEYFSLESEHSRGCSYLLVRISKAKRLARNKRHHHAKRIGQKNPSTSGNHNKEKKNENPELIQIWQVLERKSKQVKE
jgi:hypothetical protein